MNYWTAKYNTNAITKAETPTEATEVAFQVSTHRVTLGRVRCVLEMAFQVTALAQAWYTLGSLVAPDVGDIVWPGEKEPQRHLDYPVRQGGAVILVDMLFKTHKKELRPLNRENIVLGRGVLYEKHLRHFANIVEYAETNHTGDALIQCACFGEVVYG